MEKTNGDGKEKWETRKRKKTGIEKCKKENKKIYFIKKEKRRKFAAKFEIPFFFRKS